MSESDLAARLSAHEHAFEGLLDLIPAKFYNPEDAANQWNKRKQTKEEAVQAKRAKLDPSQNSRQKRHEATQTDAASESLPTSSGNAVRSVRPKKGQKQKNDEKKVGKQLHRQTVKDGTTKQRHNQTTAEADVTTSTEEPLEPSESADASSPDSSAALTHPRPAERNITEMRARLAAKIEALQSKRKAPGSGVDGAPKSRDAILEIRRKKEEARKERKRIEREARKDAEMEIKSEDDAAVEPSSSDDDEDMIAYGKLSFANGQHLKADGTTDDARKRKQQDPQSALQAALNKKARLSALPADKQAKIAESDTWHKALLQADGEKVKDDLGLLKKAVKRKEGLKKKSTKEWKERLSSIAKAKALKQKNREKNLADRKNSKGVKGGHKKAKQIGAFQGKKKKTKVGF